MAYVSIDAPLPPNGTQPMSACAVQTIQNQRAWVEQQAAKGKAEANMIAPPSAFAEFGPGVMRDAQRSQTQMSVARALTTTPNPPQPAPTIVPLNVSQAEYSGCSMRGTDGLMPIPIAAEQLHPSLPPPAPVDTGLLVTGNEFPQQTNPSVPAVVQPIVPGSGTWGAPPPVQPTTLFHAAIVPRPGMGVVWGDASASCRYNNGNGNGGPNWAGLGLLALVGLGLFAASKRGRS